MSAERVASSGKRSAGRQSSPGVWLSRSKDVKQLLERLLSSLDPGTSANAFVYDSTGLCELPLPGRLPAQLEKRIQEKPVGIGRP